MGRVRSFFLFVWRMISPLLVYELISELVFFFLLITFVFGYDTLIFTTAGALVALIPLTCWYRGWREKGEIRKDPGLQYQLQVPEVLKIAAFGMCLCVFLNVLALYVPLPWDEYDALGDQIYREPVFLQLICVGLIVPFAEEMVFRGLCYERMRTVITAVPAILISAVLFGIFHGNLIQGVYAGILGIFMAAAMERYATIMAPYVLHAAANMMSVFLTNSLINALLSYSAVFRMGSVAVSGVLAVMLILDIGKEGTKV